MKPAAVAAIRERLRGQPVRRRADRSDLGRHGRGLDELKATLARVLAETPPPRDIGKPRLPVDRVFTLPGIGTVVTGTLFGGTLRRGQSVVIQPSGKTARIRRIQSHGRDVETSGPGTRTALNLADVDALEDVHRGDVVTLRGARRAERNPRRAAGDLAERRPVAQGRRSRARASRQRQRGRARGARGRRRSWRSARARLRSCGWRPRHSSSPATASPCATGRSSTRWRARSSSIRTAIARRSARGATSSG